MSFGTPDYASLAAQSEAKRQAIINLGTQEINAIYGGGSAPFYSLASGAYNPKTQYETLGTKGFKPYGVPGQLPVPGSGNKLTKFFGGPAGIDFDPISGLAGLFSSGPESPMHHFLAAEKGNRLFTQQNQTFPGFNQGFYDQRAQAYNQF